MVVRKRGDERERAKDEKRKGEEKRIHRVSLAIDFDLLTAIHHILPFEQLLHQLAMTPVLLILDVDVGIGVPKGRPLLVTTAEEGDFRIGGGERGG